MKYVRCPKCGYIGDGLEQSCIRCGASLAGAQQFDELPADTPPSAYTAAKAWAVAATQAPGGGDSDYPYARRLAHILRPRRNGNHEQNGDDRNDHALHLAILPRGKSVISTGLMRAAMSRAVAIER